MNDRVRIQLQQGHTDIDSVVPTSISADAAISALSKLYSNNKDFKNSSQWQKALTSAIKDSTDWVKRVKQGGGLVPRGSGTVQSFRFSYDGEEYRIDIEVHGAKEADWFT